MTEAAETRATYGNWIAHRSPGLFGAGLIGTAVLFVGVVTALLVMLAAGLTPALVVLVVALVAFTATGTPAGKWVARRVVYTGTYLRREHQWRSGALSRRPQPHNRLPGVLGRSTLIAAVDSFGAPFVVVKGPGQLYSIVARCSAEGPFMQDQDRVDAWVAGWSIVLAACGQETGLVCAKAITDTAPDPGGKLAAMVTSLRADNGPRLARAVLDECVRDLPAASSENLTYLEMTFKGRSINRKGDEAAILAELARKVPGVISRMQMAGGGSVEMVTPDELPRIVRVAYDPAVQPVLEQAEINGADDEAAVAWTEAGPVASQDLWGEFVHDSGHSITWEMYGAPRSKMTERGMAALLAPHGDFARKRVALIYRPHTPDESARVAERDANTANFVAQSSKKRPSASARLVMGAAEQSRTEVAEGAASVRFSLMVTATVLAGGDVAQAVSTLEARAGAVPIRVRRCYGSQAAAFATTLPVGLVPWELTAISPKVREWL